MSVRFLPALVVLLLSAAAWPQNPASKAPTRLVQTAGRTTGAALRPESADVVRARLEGRRVIGRETPLVRESFRALTTVGPGDRVEVPVSEDEVFAGTVRLAVHADGFLRVSGELEGMAGATFMLQMNRDEVGGLVQLPERGLAYQVESGAAGEPVLRELLRSDVICAPLPRPDFPERAPLPARPELIPTDLSSRPLATAVLYLDFDGETVTDPNWNGGVTINAAPAAMTDAEITEVWQRVSEDFVPFNVDVTTNLTRYTSAPVGRRMRCIVTPTNTAAPGAGGVAYLNSFRLAGTTFSSTIPCWVFIDSNAKYCAEAVSHEFGHTFGLRHDGRVTPAETYYGGHGSGATGWAPIMGVGYYRNTVQWSKGEYTSANNTEDDLATISSVANGIGYIADEAGNVRAGAVPLTFSGGSVSQTGVVTRSTDTDFFVFSTTGGTATFSATGGAPSPNLDIVLELQDATGAVLNTSNPTSALNATITRSLPAGDYFLSIRGTGAPMPPASGYTSYASIGAYSITGVVAGGSSSSVPVIASATAAAGLRGIAFSYQIEATGSPTSYGATGSLPPGVNLNPVSGLISGTPTASGNYALTISATNASGTGTRPLTISINNGAVSLAEAVDAPGYVWVSGGADEWAGVVDVSFDGQDSAESGPIGDEQSTYIETDVAGPGAIVFRWQVDSEAGSDVLRVLIDGMEKAQISGQVSWQERTLVFPSGNHTVRWEYVKNASGAAGLDRGWVDAVSVSLLSTPVITSALNVVGEQGEEFFYQIEADNLPTSFGLTGTLPDGLVFSAANGTITGIPTGSGSTQVTISASNFAGTTEATLSIDVTPPILTLAESVDAEQFAWTTFGQQSWFPQEVVFSDGMNSAQSGAIAHGQASTIEATVIGPVALRFMWKVSSEADFDVLECLVDNAIQTAISGEVDWAAQIVAVPAGTHQVRWRYRKDSTITHGADTAWLDRVQIDTAPLIVSARTSSAKVGVPFFYLVGAINAPTLYEAVGLPLGLTIDPMTGFVTGTPQVSGTFPVQLSVSNVSGMASGGLTLTVEPSTAGADPFVLAAPLGGSWVRITATSDAATTEAGEPQHGGKPGGHSIWWTWTAPASGRVSVSTQGSIFDTTLAVYRGTTLGGLTLVAQNDNGAKAGASKVRFIAEAGEVYRIAVDGANGAAGLTTLSITYDTAATYTALVRRNDTGVIAGVASLKITPTQQYTGSVTINGYRYAFRGKLDPLLPQNHSLARRNAPSFVLTLSVNPRTGTDVVNGAVQGGVGSFAFTALRALSADDVPEAAVGTYTAKIPPVASGTGLPGGLGYATLTLARSGSVRLSGALGDAAPFSASGPLDLESNLAFHALPYRGGGLIAGPLAFDLGAAVPAIAGTLEWRKTGGSGDPLYPAGFSKAATFSGARYQRPTGERVLNFTSGFVVFGGSDLAFSPQNQPVTLTDTNRVLPGAGLPNFNAKIDLTRGLWRGGFQAGVGGPKRTFSGAIMRGENRGVGVYSGTAQSGSVTLSETP